MEKLTLWSRNAPIYVQLKYHGISARYIPGQGLFTRQGKKWDLSRFPAEFTRDFAAAEDFVLYGELVIPDVAFPTAAGILNVNSDLPIPSSLRFHLFDCEHISKPATDQTYSWRLSQAQTFHFNFISPAPTYIHTDPIYADHRYTFAIERNYEGVVYRIDPALLLYGDRPNPFIVKRKKLHSAEAICVSAEEGKGKRAGLLGALILRLDNGKSLKVGGGAGMTDELLSSLWTNPPIGKLVTYTFEELSEDSIPLRPQFVAVRSYE